LAASITRPGDLRQQLRIAHRGIPARSPAERDAPHPRPAGRVHVPPDWWGSTVPRRRRRRRTPRHPPGPPGCASVLR
jgi:hypothetical protein